MFLEECKYVIKEKKIHHYNTDDVESSSDSEEENLEKIQTKENSDKEDSSKEDSSEEGSSEEDSD